MAKFGHIDKRLTDISIQYNQSEFVGGNLFPEMPVAKGSDKYLVYAKGNQFQSVDDNLSKNSDANEVQLGFTEATYSVKDYGLRGYVTPEDIANADDPLAPEADEVEVLTSTILNKREIRIKAVVDTMSTNTASPSTKWTFSAGTPVTDIEAGANAMFRRPNVMIVSRPVWDQMKFNADIIAKIGGGFTGLKMASEAMVAELFGLEKVIVADAKIDANIQPQSASLSYIWGKSVVLAYVDTRNSKKIVTFGRLFAQKMLANGGTGNTFQVRTWEDPSKGLGGRKVIQVEHASVETMISEDFGYHLTDCIA